MASTRSVPALLILAIIAGGVCCTAYAYWPGLVTGDGVRIYDLATQGRPDDWHPPVLEWLWGLIARRWPSPTPIMLLQLGLYWSGIGLLAVRALHERRNRLAVALAAAGLLPLALALNGAVLKDSLMTGALLAATGCLVWRWRVAGFALLLFAATMRFNAFLACLPLAVALTGARTWPRLVLATTGSALVLLAVMPVTNRLIGTQKSYVELSLVIFDLAGIAAHGGDSHFPAFGVDDPARVAAACYSPVRWDSFSDWVEPECAIGYTAFRQRLERSGESPYRWWLSAVLAHPAAYAEHRLEHFNLNTRFLVRGDVERPVQAVSAPNDWGFQVTPNPMLSVIDRLAIATARSPVGWPILWIAIAFGLVVIGPRLPSRDLVVPLALSVLLYGLGYLVVSVAVEMRYHLWTILGGLIAAIVAVADLRQMPVIPWRRIAAALSPAALVLVLGLAYRAA